MNSLAASAIGGLLATAPMTVVMTTMFQKLQRSEQYPLPPREITEVFVDRVLGPGSIGNRQLTSLSLVAHFAYGAATGALYPLFYRQPKHRIVDGGLFGLSVWAASYLGWLPAAKILRPATQHPLSRNALMLLAHIVWGAGTVLIGETLRTQKPTLESRRRG